MSHLAFETALAPGMKVEARWTNCHNYYGEPAEIVRVNRSSVRVRVLAGYLAGRETSMPRMFGNKWSANNGVFPWNEEAYTARKVKEAKLEAAMKKFFESRPTNNHATTT